MKKKKTVELKSSWLQIMFLNGCYFFLSDYSIVWCSIIHMIYLACFLLSLCLFSLILPFVRMEWCSFCTFSLEKRSPPLASSRTAPFAISGTAPFTIGWQMMRNWNRYGHFFNQGNLKPKNSRVRKHDGLFIVKYSLSLND